MKFNKYIYTFLTLSLSLFSCNLDNAIVTENVSIVENNQIAISSYEEIGGKTYESFKVNPELPKAKGEKKAVKLTYFITDDKAHQSPWSDKMLKMMDDLPQKDVYNIVFRDGNVSGDSKLYYIDGGDTSPDTIRSSQSFLAKGVNEVQSNNARLFQQILSWTLDTYPAKKKYLQIYTHGGGVFGIGSDENQTDLKSNVLPKEEQIGMMKPTKFAEALRQALKGRKLDLIYFRACLMGNLEALYELRDTTKYVIASEDVSYSVENSNITMTKMFEDLSSKDLAPKEVARQMTIQANGKHGGPSDGYTVIAAIEIEKLTNLKMAINELSLALRASLNTELKAIQQSYDAVPTVKGLMKPEAFHNHMRDLWRFMVELDKRVVSKSLKQAIQNVKKAQNIAMIHEKDSLGGFANGLSIFMPTSDTLKEPNSMMFQFLKNNYQKVRFAKDTAWDEFLKDFSTK